MAASSKDENSKVNPFSFSNFVLKQDEPEIPPTNDDDEEIDEENPFTFEKFNKKSDSDNKKKPIKSRKLQIIEDVDAVTDIFADLPQTSLNVKTKKKNTDKKSKPTFQNDIDLLEDPLESSEELSNSPQTDTYILHDSLPTPKDELIVQLQELKHQNAELQRDVERIKKEFKEYTNTSNKKISSLRNELDKTRKREAEDTNTLEDVAKKVEENLQTTTARALKAEATVIKLKEELRSIKENQVPLGEYHALQLQHFHQLNTIKEKSKNAAQLMRAAADKTDPQIRRLQSGISSLRFLADTFDDLGMVSELPKKPDGIT